MKIILELLNSKIFLYVLIACVSGVAFGVNKCQSDANAEYKRQLEGDLNDKEIELQKLNTELGVSKSTLLKQSDLYDILKKEKEEVDKEFNKFKRKHKLQIVSRDITIAELRQRINGGDTVVVVSEEPGCENVKQCPISYHWKDKFKRFELIDPNIFKDGNVVFTTKQVFKIYGEVYKQKDGMLKTRRLVLREVVLDKDGKYVPVDDGKANIVDSQFQYSYSSNTLNQRGLFKLLPIVVGSVAFDGQTQLGLGIEFMQWKGLGFNTNTSFIFDDMKNSRQNIGVSYSPKILGQELNLALGLSIGTPFNDLFNNYTTKLDLVFYISD